MKAMLFAAGLGTRLKPLTDSMPKALVPVAGKPMLEHVLLKLKAAGCDEVVINIHHFGEQILDFLRHGKVEKVRCYLVIRRPVVGVLVSPHIVQYLFVMHDCRIEAVVIFLRRNCRLICLRAFVPVDCFVNKSLSVFLVLSEVGKVIPRLNGCHPLNIDIRSSGLPCLFCTACNP